MRRCLDIAHFDFRRSVNLNAVIGAMSTAVLRAMFDAEYSRVEDGSWIERQPNAVRELVGYRAGCEDRPERSWEPLEDPSRARWRSLAE